MAVFLYLGSALKWFYLGSSFLNYKFYLALFLMVIGAFLRAKDELIYKNKRNKKQDL